MFGRVVSKFIRILDIITTLLASMIRFFSGGFVAADIERCPRPAKYLKLYEYEGCPLCCQVRETLSMLDLDAEIYPCPKPSRGVPSRFREGKQSFPTLIDENTGTTLNDSNRIINYLFETYGKVNGKRILAPLTYRFYNFKLLHPTLYLASFLRPLPYMGNYAVPSTKPEKLLELWSFESSPFCKLVREALSSLQIPYKLRNVAKGSKSKRNEFKNLHGDIISKTRLSLGLIQIPFLVDPNTKMELLESEDIIRYLYSTYGGFAIEEKQKTS